MSGYSQIKTKVEAAFAAVIAAYGGTDLSGVTIYRRFGGAEVKGAHIEVICERAEPETMGDTTTGNWTCEVAVAYLAHNSVPYSTRTAAENALFDVLMRDDFVTLLNAAGVADFTVMGGDSGAGQGSGWTPGPVMTEENPGNGMLREMMTGTLYCNSTGG